MKLQYNITMQHLVDFNLYHAKNSKYFRIKFLLLMIILPIIMGLYILFTVIMGSFSLAAVIIPAVVSLAWVLLYPTIFKKSIATSVVNLYSEGKNHEVLTAHTLSLENGKLVEETGNSRNEQAIATIENIIETPEYVFIYLSAMTAHIIPRKEIADSKLLDEFVKALKEG
ncbi:MAG: YcxB family protein [Spirochaetaceae bacterium]|nr:MAG: YcxB family protein [Spirochaetaceae bacterium]